MSWEQQAGGESAASNLVPMLGQAHRFAPGVERRRCVPPSLCAAALSHLNVCFYAGPQRCTFHSTWFKARPAVVCQLALQLTFFRLTCKQWSGYGSLCDTFTAGFSVTLQSQSVSCASTLALVQTCERNKKLGYMWVVIFGAVAIFPWQWSQIQLTLISVFSQTRYVWEKASLCPPSIKAWSLPLLNMLIRSVVPLLFLLAHETPAALLSLPFHVGKKGDLGSLQLRLGGPGLHPP